jgi:hypothetical protein
LRVEVHFYGFVRDVMRDPMLSMEMSAGCTLGDLFDQLAENTKLRERLLTSSGQLETNTQVFIGDTRAASLNEPLGDSQNDFTKVKVFVLSATAGG